MRENGGVYKRKCDGKIDALMECISPMERKYTKRERAELIAVGVLFVVAVIGLCEQYLQIDESEKLMRYAYCGLLIACAWMVLYFAVGCLYIQFRFKWLKSIYAGLGYMAVIFGGFFGACLTVLEMLAQRTNIYHIYKYFYLMFMSMPYTVLFVAISWKILCAFEGKYRYYFSLIDWYFVSWIFFYIIIKYVFWLCMKVGCYFLKIETKIARCILDEMSILFYMVLVVCMVCIWGRAGWTYSENKLLMEGFLNATTVLVLYGTIRDKIRHGKVDTL